MPPLLLPGPQVEVPSAEAWQNLVHRVGDLEYAVTHGPSVPRPVFSIDSAVGTDVAPRVQQVLRDAAVVKGTVRLGPGYWNWGSRVFLPSNVWLVLMPNTTVNYTGPDGSHFLCLNNDNGKPFKEYKGPGYSRVMGGIWNCAKKAKGFSFCHGHNLVIQGLTIKDSYGHHLELNACRDVLVDTVKFYGVRDSDSSLPEAVLLDYARSNSAPYTGTDGTPCSNITVRSCVFRKSGTQGTVAPPRGFGSSFASLSTKNRHKGIILERNVFDGCWAEDAAALRVFNMAGVTIRNNAFQDVARAIGVIVGSKGCSVSSVTITANQINAGGKDGKTLDAIEVNAANDNPKRQRITGLTISGNQVHNWRGTTGAYGIVVSETTTGKIKNNTVDNRISGPTATRSDMIFRASSCINVVVEGNLPDNT